MVGFKICKTLDFIIWQKNNMAKMKKINISCGHVCEEVIVKYSTYTHVPAVFIETSKL